MRITNEPNTAAGKEESPFQREKPKTFRELTLRQKITYVWDYHRWPILITALILVISAISLPQFIENHKEAALYAVFVNTQIVDQDSTTLMDDFIKEENIDMDDKRIVLDTSLIINRDRGDTTSMQCNQKLLALFASDTPDVLLCDEENFQFYADAHCFRNLKDVLPADLFEKYKPYMLTCDTDNSDEPVYYGVSVKTSKVLADEKAYIIDPIFTISKTATQTENAVKFLEFLLKEEITPESH